MGGWRRLLTADTPGWLLLGVSGPLLVLQLAIAGLEDRVLSRAMVWDLLYLLGGAWHLHAGHVPRSEERRVGKECW